MRQVNVWVKTQGRIGGECEPNLGLVFLIFFFFLLFTSFSIIVHTSQLLLLTTNSVSTNTFISHTQMTALPESVLIKLVDSSPNVKEDLYVRTVLLSPSNSFKVVIGRASQLQQPVSENEQRLAKSNNALFLQRGISRVHGYFFFEDGSLWYQDRRSRNGTRIAGRGLVTHKIRLSSKEGIISKLIFAPNLSSSQSLTLSVQIVKIVYKEEGHKMSEKEIQLATDLKCTKSDVKFYNNQETNDEAFVLYTRPGENIYKNPRKRFIEESEENDDDDDETKKPKKKQKKTNNKPSEAWSFTAGLFAGSLCTLATLVAIGASSST